MSEIIGYTGKTCGSCQKVTPHKIIKGDGCLLKRCLICEQRRLHPYANEGGKTDSKGQEGRIM